MHADVAAGYARAAELAGARGRVVVAGDSAGGTLVAALCLALAAARAARGGGAPSPFGPPRALAALPPPALQVLLYAALDAECAAASAARYGDAWMLTAKLRAFFKKAYLAGDDAAAAERGRDYFFSPLRAPRDVLARAPRALVVSAEHDAVRDDGEDYAAALAAAGVRAEFVQADGLIHGFATLNAARARAAVEDVARRIVAIAEEEDAGGEEGGAGGGGAGGAGGAGAGGAGGAPAPSLDKLLPSAEALLARFGKKKAGRSGGADDEPGGGDDDGEPVAPLVAAAGGRVRGSRRRGGV